MEVELSKKCTPLWRRKAHVHVQNTPCSEHFWKLRCRKSARRCGLKHISKSKCTKHHMLGALLEVEMSKSARHCGAKHISKSTCTKHTMLGALLEVEMSKKYTPLWREAHVQVNMYKDTNFGALLEVEMSKKCTPLWPEAHFQVKSGKKADGYGALLDVHMWFRVAGARDCAPCQK